MIIAVQYNLADDLFIKSFWESLCWHILGTRLLYQQGCRVGIPCCAKFVFQLCPMQNLATNASTSGSAFVSACQISRFNRVTSMDCTFACPSGLWMISGFCRSQHSFSAMVAEISSACNGFAHIPHFRPKPLICFRMPV